MSVDFCEIWIPLRNEGTIAAKMTKGVSLPGDEYIVIMPDEYDPQDEEWEFLPGTIVKCRKEIWSEGEILVAYEQVKSNVYKGKSFSKK